MEKLTDNLKKVILAGIGAVATTAEKSKDVLDDMVKKGELTVEQGKVLNEELKHNLKQTVKNNVNVKVKVTTPEELSELLDKMTPEQLEALKAQIGMLATVMNCIYVSEIFRSVGMKTAVLTPFECGSFTKLFSKDRANKYFSRGMVVFFAGGTGHPYFSTDTGVVLRAIEVEAEVILLAKSIDGVYDKDPKTSQDAKKYDSITIDEVIEKNLQVVDMTASILARDNKMPMWVFGLNEENSIVNTVNGKFTGTRVTV